MTTFFHDMEVLTNGQEEGREEEGCKEKSREEEGRKKESSQEEEIEASPYSVCKKAIDERWLSFCLPHYMQIFDQEIHVTDSEPTT